MTPPASPAWRWQSHDELASTQDEAIGAVCGGDPGRLAVLAFRQTAGRGSRGRPWDAPDGNLNLSLLLRPASVRPDPGYWLMLTGVALFEALRPFTDGLMLKWPNDVLLHGAKLGGVLIDSALRADGTLHWIVLGFGVNLARAPNVEGRPTACLPPPAPDARAIAGSVVMQVEAFATADLRAAWLARAHPLGTELDVATPARRVRGRFAGLTQRGELLLQGDPVPVSSAEVFLTPRATPAPQPGTAA